MNYILSCFLIVIPLIIPIHAGPDESQKAECTKLDTTIDQGFKYALLISDRITIPNTEAKLTDYCKEAKRLSKNVAKYGKCTTPFPDQILRFLSNGVKKQIKVICKTKRSWAIKNFDCMNEEYLRNVQSFGNALIDQIQYAGDNQTVEKVLPNICCSFHYMLNRIPGAPKPTCSDSKMNVNSFVQKFLTDALEDVLNLICGSYSSKDVCIEREPELYSQFDSMDGSHVNIYKDQLFTTIMKAVTRLS